MRHGGKGNVGLRPFQAARPSTAEAAMCPSRFCQEARNVRSGQRNGLPYDGLRSDFAMGRALENWRLRVDSNHSAPPWLERPDRVGLCRSPFSPRMTWLGRVGMWRDGVRSGISVAAPFARAVPYRPDHSSVSTPLSSNRTCGLPASGSRTRPHAFVHDTSCPSRLRSTSPRCPYRRESG